MWPTILKSVNKEFRVSGAKKGVCVVSMMARMFMQSHAVLIGEHADRAIARESTALDFLACASACSDLVSLCVVFIASCCIVRAVCVVQSTLHAHTATAEHNMIATVHPIATDAGLAVFREGGNAVDAAVTAALTLGVVDGENSGIGGGCLILIRTADGKFTAIDGREMAPAAANKNMFVRDGKPMPTASQTGPLASGVPGRSRLTRLRLRSAGRSSWPVRCAPGDQSGARWV